MVLYLSCPLCGKLSHLSCFNPDRYDDDIKCVEMQSRGRAKGFEVTRRFSALDDEELMDLISSRCRAILKIVGEEVTEKSSVTALEKELGKWRTEVLGLREVENQLNDEIVGLQKSVDDYEEEMDGLLAQVNGVLPDIYEEFSYLENAVEALIEEYQEAVEEEEDEDGS